MPKYHLRHNFRSMLPDSGDPTTVGPYQWNDEHAVLFDAPGVLASVDGVTVDVMSFSDLTVIVSINIQTQINNTFAALVGNFDGTSVALWALKLSLAQGVIDPATQAITGNLLTKAVNALPAFQDDPISVRWNNQLYVTKGDAFYGWVQTTLALSGAVMQLLMSAAKTIAAAG